jgi:hypothetical protein
MDQAPIFPATRRRPTRRDKRAIADKTTTAQSTTQQLPFLALTYIISCTTTTGTKQKASRGRKLLTFARPIFPCFPGQSSTPDSSRLRCLRRSSDWVIGAQKPVHTKPACDTPPSLRIPNPAMAMPLGNPPHSTTALHMAGFLVVDQVQKFVSSFSSSAGTSNADH